MEWNVVLTPRSPRWAEFIEELGKAPICRQTDQYARRALEKMTGVDVEASLEALHVLGGRCDCEIFFDLAGREDRHEQDRFVSAGGGRPA